MPATMAVFRIVPAFAALALLALPSPAPADTLVDHVDGITPDAGAGGGGSGIAHFTGLVIGNDGRIARVLHAGEPRPRTDFAFDAHGAVMLPGFVDAHVHVMDLGFASLTLDLSDTHSLAEAQARIAAYAAAHPDRPWILGRGWDRERWGIKDAAGHARFPTAAELDAAIADRPVWLIDSDGHAGWANGRAMALAGVTASSKVPEGGRIERLPAAGKGVAPGRAPGRPSGIFIDAAETLVSKAVTPPRPEDRDLALATAQAILLKRGVTTVCDMGTSIEDWQAFRRAGDAGRLAIRIVAYADGIENMTLIGGPGPTPWLYDDRLRLAGVYLRADGALGSRGAWLKAPYADAPGERGIQRLTDTQLKNLMSRAAMDHFQVAVHATGDAAGAEVLDALDDLSGTYKGERRWRLEQAEAVDPADVPRFGPLALKAGGIAISLQPLRQAADRAMVEARLGRDRFAEASTWRSIAAADTMLAFGSGAPAAPPDAFAGMAAAIGGEGQPQAPLSREEALTAATAGAAWAGFAENRVGRIAPGLRADFVLVDRNPLQASASDLATAKILQVWIGGERVWQAADGK